VKEIILVQLTRRANLVHELETAFEPLAHGHGDGMIQPHDWRRIDSQELGIECRNLRPIRIRGSLGLGVDSRDCGLQLIRADPVET
jgi:hypothetical protein